MARSMEAVKVFAEVNSKEEDLLNSPARPVVLLNKKSSYNLSQLVAPDLNNVGVMLPTLQCTKCYSTLWMTLLS